MNDLGKGIGTCGIWIGIALIYILSPHNGITPPICGAAATAFIWGINPFG